MSAITPRMALFTALTDGEASTVTEVSGNNYSRAAVTFGAPSGGIMTNSGIVSFATPSGSSVRLSVRCWDAASAGNGIYYSDQTPNKTINTNDVVEFAAAAISIQET